MNDLQRYKQCALIAVEGMFAHETLAVRVIRVQRVDYWPPMGDEPPKKTLMRAASESLQRDLCEALAEPIHAHIRSAIQKASTCEEVDALMCIVLDLGWKNSAYMRLGAALRLQKAVRAALASPYTALGKRRLLREYGELADM